MGATASSQVLEECQWSPEECEQLSAAFGAILLGSKPHGPGETPKVRTPTIGVRTSCGAGWRARMHDRVSTKERGVCLCVCGG